MERIIGTHVRIIGRNFENCRIFGSGLVHSTSNQQKVWMEPTMMCESRVFYTPYLKMITEINEIHTEEDPIISRKLYAYMLGSVLSTQACLCI